jgi:hypothetical protein
MPPRARPASRSTSRDELTAAGPRARRVAAPAGQGGGGRRAAGRAECGRGNRFARRVKGSHGSVWLLCRSILPNSTHSMRNWGRLLC